MQKLDQRLTRGRYHAMLDDGRMTTTVRANDVRDALHRGPAHIFVVLDDDPTGTQSVRDLPVLTRWDREDFDWAFGLGVDAVYVLTNTRSLDEAEAAVRNREIATAATAAAEPLGLAVSFVSRGDSTLRDHFPLETDTLAATVLERTGTPIDGVLLVPAFPDAGRVTIDGIHLLRAGGGDTPMIDTPIAETEFARDATFGYRSSDLADYVEEKSGGRTSAASVTRITLELIREGEVEVIAGMLADAVDGAVFVADAEVEGDLLVVALALTIAREQGTRILVRCGPPFVRALIGQEPSTPLLDAAPEEADAALTAQLPSARGHGGLVVVGSHVGITAGQFAHLVATEPFECSLQIEVGRLSDALDRAAHLDDLVTRASEALRSGTVLLFTSRGLVKTADPDTSLAIARAVSDAVSEVVRRVVELVLPAFIVAKGGITSSDVATRGLGVRRAMVVGPMLPGTVSLWRPADGPAAGIPYVVFPGNVGDETALSRVVRALRSPASP